ncbi:protein C-mannosyl-transferase DPY19L1 [Anticarsia gemmatalis]|uniref:protein C-mannosyl-transferase DPY19L1 n=1 Tax=Anticarsia gemmatalis TaxID=129554 RepID=UPI003F775081
MEENKVEPKAEVKRKFPTKKFAKGCLIATIAFSIGYLHYRYVSHLFENDRNFSYLSEMEREMSFRTEMGFYYSYYKTVIEERPFIAGISKLMYDRLVEYPKDVNAFNRFNIHPEVIIGALYRYLEPYINTSSHRECHMVDRGGGLAPVESCVGIGHPVYFYLETIWWLAGLTLAAVFLYAAALSESLLGGLLAVAQYLANHSEATRVQWAPNERENLAAPLLLLQTWLVTQQLRDHQRRTTFQLQVSIFVLNCLCLLFWQFTQFIFLTQTAIFFVMEQLRIIDIKSLCIFLHSHFCGLHMAVLLLQGNDMLKSSLYASFFLIVSVYCLFFSSFRIKVQNRIDIFVEAWLVLLRIAIVIFASIYTKKLISNFLEVQEDSHIWDILYSKFTNFKSFHTMIYTCSEVFDFLPWSSVKKLLKSCLIPFALLSVVNMCTYWVSCSISLCKKETATPTIEKENISDESDSGIENSDTKLRKRKLVTDLDLIDRDLKSKIDQGVENEDYWLLFLKNLRVDPGVFYSISQMVVFGIMALLVMRLKLLFVTQMCVVSGLMMNTSYYMVPKSYKRFIPFFWIISMSPLVHEMFHGITEELSHIGEFSDVSQEQLMEWIKAETPVTAAFAGSMPILASIMLITRRPIVAHPHYEHQEARERAYAVYKTYGRFTPHELYQELNKLRATHLVVETKYCYGRSSKGCSFQDIWDAETPWHAARASTCRVLLNERVEHFYRVFSNQHYAVFSVHDYSVRYMPRSFDT